MKIFYIKDIRIIAIILLVACVVIALYRFLPRSVADNDTTISLAQPSRNSAPEIAPTKSQPIESVKDIDSKQMSYIVLTPNEEAEIKSWMHSRGYFGTKDVSVYETYSDQILDDLAKQGDLKALDILITRMVHSGDIKSAVRYASTAAIFGSTTALDALTLFTAPQVKHSEEEARAAVLETIALTKVIEMRGDFTLADSSRRGLAIGHNVDLTLTSEEKTLVENRAKEIYGKYENIRIAKGLGPFDNSMPLIKR